MSTQITTDVEPKEIAEYAGLIYVNDKKPGITRLKEKNRFKYFSVSGKEITDEKEIKRLNALAIPPAYTGVWICPKPNGHIQATGRDAKGRKQYRYHKRWREASDENKYTKMIAFGKALPTIRKQMNKDLSLPDMPREKVLAAIVYLLEVTLIRVGNEEYVKENHSFGLTTMRNHHVDIAGPKMTFKFKGKSGKQHNIKLKDKRLARIVRKCKDLPGQDLFEYVDDNDQIATVSSTDVNEYLNHMTNEHFTAKDFRTWAGTVLAVCALQEFLEFDTEAQAKKNIVAAIEKVAERLGNTPSICRKCYVHPEIFTAYMDRQLIKFLKQQTEEKSLQDMCPEEAAVLIFLEQRLEKELKKEG